jgi:hypothetical protein
MMNTAAFTKELMYKAAFGLIIGAITGVFTGLTASSFIPVPAPDVNLFCQQVIANNCTVYQPTGNDDDYNGDATFPDCDNFQGKDNCNLDQQNDWFNNATQDINQRSNHILTISTIVGAMLGLAIAVYKYWNSPEARLFRMTRHTEVGTQLLADDRSSSTATTPKTLTAQPAGREHPIASRLAAIWPGRISHASPTNATVIEMRAV